MTVFGGVPPSAVSIPRTTTFGQAGVTGKTLYSGQDKGKDQVTFGHSHGDHGKSSTDTPKITSFAKDIKSIDMNAVGWDPDVKHLYTIGGKPLTPWQKRMDGWVRFYQNHTRYSKGWASFFGKGISDGCGFKKRKLLSCSEYMIVCIHAFGPVKGVIRGAKRLIRCNPFQRAFKDPVYKV